MEQSEEKELAALEKRRKIKAKTHDLLENGEENIQKLKEAIEANSNKLIGLVNQWEKHRLPLIQKYREEREKHSSKAVRTFVAFITKKETIQICSFFPIISYQVKLQFRENFLQILVNLLFNFIKRFPFLECKSEKTRRAKESKRKRKGTN